MVGMAQPLKDGFPPIRLFLFGSDNKFNTEAVKNRLDFVIKSLTAVGIRVLTYSTDGDSREMKLMRDHLRLGAPLQETFNADMSERISLRKKWPWFVCDYPHDNISIQDTVHLGAKLRTRLLKLQKPMPFGKMVANMAHLINLQRQLSKDKHLIRESDLFPQDKMNYDAVQRLCDPQVSLLLETEIPDSSGTCFYLTLMRCLTSSYLDKTLDPLQRVYNLCFAVFSLRYWRFWLSCDDAYPLAKHFITLNAYLCAEINAHACIMLITTLREDGTPELFKPWLYGSQQCETFFKAVRSCTTYGSTAVNFSLRELLYSRCRKVDTHLLLTALGVEDNINYPRFRSRHGGISGNYFVCSSFPSMEEIEATVLRAQKDAEDKLKSLGVEVDGGNPFGFDSRLASKLSNSETSQAADLDDNEDDNMDDDECEKTIKGSEEEPNNETVEETVEEYANDSVDCDVLGIDDYDASILNSIGNGSFKDYTSQLEKACMKSEQKNQKKRNKTQFSDGSDGIQESVDIFVESSPFALVTDRDEKVRAVRKSAIVWVLENGVRKLSNDRTTRVMQSTSFSSCDMLVTKIVEKRKIRIGDWCVFQSEPDTRRGQGRGNKNKDSDERVRVMMGHVLSFSALAGSKKQMNETILEWEDDENVGALCHWYNFEHNRQKITGKLIQVEVSVHGFHPCRFYVCSVPPPQLVFDNDESCVCLSDVTVYNLAENLAQYNKQHVF